MYGLFQGLKHGPLVQSIQEVSSATFQQFSYPTYDIYLLGRKSIKYLGVKVNYDARVTPVGLMLYPEEVNKILQHMDTPPKNVLDIGANIGQFAITLASLNPLATIDSLEPLPAAFTLLESNTVNLHNINTYCIGVGPGGRRDIHFLPERSVNASLIKSNANYRLPDRKSTKQAIELTDDIPSLTKRKKYDLVKIDVEGFEYQAIKSLSGVSASYLYIEITGSERHKDYRHSELLKAIEDTFGTYDLLYTTRDSAAKFEVLLSFRQLTST